MPGSYNVVRNEALEAAKRASTLAAGAAVAGTLRCLFNPFAPAFDPAWITSDAHALAAAIYTDRAFDRLPILADALQDAGCEDAAVLDHLRCSSPHAKGCWVLDIILGKS